MNNDWRGYQDELYHHGIRGMKWGVRRYQNYDGSYTQAGMKRYNKSLEAYNQADAQYKNVKKMVKETKKNGHYTTPEGQQIAVMPSVLKEAKQNKKSAKRQLEKDYRHLKQDKLGDQGKELYASGKTITGNERVTGLLNTIGTVGLSAAAYNVRTGGQLNKLLKQYTGVNINDKQFAAIVGGVGVGALGASAAKRGVDEYQNKRLRAYYGHTSNY